MPEPYELSARFYDRVYATKRYLHEADAIRSLVTRHDPSATTLLEVGCGTGGHLIFLKDWFEVEGVDLSSAMLDVARSKLPGVTLYQDDMRSFKLARRFDVVACLFSSIGYVRSIEELNDAIANLAHHLKPGGLLIVEPWFTPEQWRPGSVHGGLLIDEQNLKLFRCVVSETRGRFAVTPMHHLLAEPTGVTHFVEHHELLLATTAEYAQSLARAGLQDVTFDAEALPRGAWIGRSPMGGA